MPLVLHCFGKKTRSYKVWSNSGFWAVKENCSVVICHIACKFSVPLLSKNNRVVDGVR